MNNNKVVYRHIRKDTNKVFYIGMGTVKRPYVRYGRSKHWNSIVEKGGLIVDVVAFNLTVESASDLEILLIYEYGLDNLCNHTLGGEGVSGSSHWKGRKHSKETIEKCRLINKGRKRSDETKEKIRDANLGKKLSEEHKKKIERGKKVIDTSTNIVYKNIKKGAEAIGRNQTTITHQLSGRKKIQSYNTLRYC
jgi:hypothetical protein